jgi:hypothetical protein
LVFANTPAPVESFLRPGGSAFAVAQKRIEIRLQRLTTLRLARLILLLCPAALSAHDLYLLPASYHPKVGEHLRVAFHNGDSFPESEVAPTPARLRDARISSVSGKAGVENLQIAGKETFGDVIVPAGGGLILSVATVPNFIELAPDKFVAYLKEEGLDQVMAWRGSHHEEAKPGRERYTKFAKSLLRGEGKDDYSQQPLGLKIEIVPLTNPYDLHVGSTLPVWVLFEGKPAAGLQLEAARAGRAGSKTTVIGRTGSDGRINIPVDQTGQWRLHSLRMERCLEPTVADWESSWASLTFEIQ